MNNTNITFSATLMRGSCGHRTEEIIAPNQSASRLEKPPTSISFVFEAVNEDDLLSHITTFLVSNDIPSDSIFVINAVRGRLKPTQDGGFEDKEAYFSTTWLQRYVDRINDSNSSMLRSRMFFPVEILINGAKTVFDMALLSEKYRSPQQHRSI